MWNKILSKARSMTPTKVRKTFTIIIGFTLLIFGIILIFTPGPAIVVIPLALFVLSSEFAWARYWIRSIKHHVTKINGDLGKYFPEDADDAEKK